MNDKLESSLKALAQQHRGLLEVAVRLTNASNGEVFPFDLLANAAIARSMSLNSAFVTLMRADNFLAAAHLVRLHLDTVLRFSAGWIVEDCHDFASRVLKGVAVRKQQDRAGAKMTDAYLVELLAKAYPWASSVYQATSGYVHLSEKHIFNTLAASDQPMTLTIRISGDGGSIPEATKIEATEAMIAITDALQRFLEGWLKTKSGPKTDQPKPVP